MAPATKKGIKTKSKRARMTAKPKAAARTAKMRSKPPAGKKTRTTKIDALNRKNYHAVTTMVTVADMRRAMNFYSAAFGFKPKAVMDTPQGIMHAELTLRDSTLMLGPESRE